MTASAPRLALESISRRYGSVHALDAAHLRVATGEVHALLGENGAGKSTLMKVAFGLEQPDSGTIRLDGAAVSFRSPRDAMRHGIGMVQQHFALVGAMTVAENVALATAGQLNLDATRASVQRIGAAAGLTLDPDVLADDLTVAAQQRLEIIKALSRNSRIIILDEPTAVLAPSEAADVLAWARRFADAGGTVILIAHKLREVLAVADVITVMRKGKTVLTIAANNATEAVLADAMLGAPIGVAQRRDTSTTGVIRPVITVSGATLRDTRGLQRLTNVSLVANAHEILGIAAVEGSGQYELLRVMAGRATATAGTVSLPAQVGFVPEDRHRDAVVLDGTLTENVALQGASVRRGTMPWNVLRIETATLMAQRDVRASGPDAAMRSLSGGNQQKLVLGRELAASPQALVVESPTRGLDIRATASVHHALREARDRGTAVVVYSSDLDEVLTLADRVLVVAAGTVRELARDRDLVGRAMLEGDGSL